MALSGSILDKNVENFSKLHAYVPICKRVHPCPITCMKEILASLLTVTRSVAKRGGQSRGAEV